MAGRIHVLVPHLLDYRVVRGGTNVYRAITLAAAHLAPTVVHHVAPEPDEQIFGERAVIRTYPSSRRLAAALADSLGPGDVVIKCAGAGRGADHFLDHRTVSAALDAGARTVYLDPDVASRLAMMPARHYLSDLLPLVDHVILLAGGPKAQTAYHRLGAVEVTRLSSALCTYALPYQAKPPAYDERDIDLLVTVGGASTRDARLRTWLDAARDAGAEIVVVGDWDPADRYVSHVPLCDPRDLFRYYHRARHTLNLVRDIMRRYGHAPANRVFEAGIAGSVLITEPYEGLEEDLLPDVECRTVSGSAELAAALRQDPHDWHSMSTAGHARVVSSAHHALAGLHDVVAGLLGHPGAARDRAVTTPPPSLAQLDGRPIVAVGAVPVEAIAAVSRRLPNSRCDVRPHCVAAELPPDAVLLTTAEHKDTVDTELSGRPPLAMLVWRDEDADEDADAGSRPRWLAGRDWLLGARSAAR